MQNIAVMTINNKAKQTKIPINDIAITILMIAHHFALM